MSHYGSYVDQFWRVGARRLDRMPGTHLDRTLGTQQFNVRNQLTQIEAKINSVSQMKLGFDYGTSNNTGDIRSRTDHLQPEHSASFSYDELRRLTGAANPAWSIGWGYDGWGNRTSQTPSGLASGRVGSASLQFDDNRNLNYNYDAAGHVTQIPFGAGTANLSWDAEGRLTAFASTASYAYDGYGRRVKRTVGSVTTYYVYGLTGLMSEFSTVNTGITAAASTDRVTFQVGDQTGTAVLIANGAGTVIENNRRFPFGEPFEGEENPLSINDQKFTTFDHDSATGLDYAMARWYAGRDGRFMSPDSPGADQHIGDPQSWNLYAYARNNPLMFLDSTGRYKTAVHDAIIEGAFRGLTAFQRKAFQAGSFAVDFGYCAQIKAECAHMHAMDYPWGKSTTARWKFIFDMERKAREMQRTLSSETPARAKQGAEQRMFFLFGQAMHPVMDQYSPSHRDQVFEDIHWVRGLLDFETEGVKELRGILKHGEPDKTISWTEYEAAVNALRTEYLLTFGQEEFERATGGCKSLMKCKIDYEVVPKERRR